MKQIRFYAENFVPFIRVGFVLNTSKLQSKEIILCDKYERYSLTVVFKTHPGAPRAVISVLTPYESPSELATLLTYFQARSATKKWHFLWWPGSCSR